MSASPALNRWLKKRPRWSLRTGFWLSMGVVAVVAIVVLVFTEKSIWVELEMVLAILSVFLFTFLFYVLYSGIVFQRGEAMEISWKGGALKDWIDFAGHADTGGVFTGAGAEGGPIGFIIGLILDLLVSMILVLLVAFLLWLGLGALFTAIFILSVPLFFMVQRSLRSAVARGRSCRGRVSKSLRHALSSTAVNMVWLYCILFAGHALGGFFAAP